MAAVSRELEVVGRWASGCAVDRCHWWKIITYQVHLLQPNPCRFRTGNRKLRKHTHPVPCEFVIRIRVGVGGALEVSNKVSTHIDHDFVLHSYIVLGLGTLNNILENERISVAGRRCLHGEVQAVPEIRKNTRQSVGGIVAPNLPTVETPRSIPIVNIIICQFAKPNCAVVYT